MVIAQVTVVLRIVASLGQVLLLWMLTEGLELNLGLVLRLKSRGIRHWSIDCWCKGKRRDGRYDVSGVCNVIGSCVGGY